MPTYRIMSLVDITRTNPHRSETDTMLLSQQANFNSLIQAIGLRSNVAWEQDPIRYEGSLPHPFEGRGAYWSWEFTVEREDIFFNENGPVGLLIEDLHNVPIITNLTETVDIDPAVFQTRGSRINIYSEIKV
jgi:hypothetical protein